MSDIVTTISSPGTIVGKISAPVEIVVNLGSVVNDITTTISSPGIIIGNMSTPAEIIVTLGTGIQGRPGDVGPKGDTGATGPAGETGATGPAGEGFSQELLDQKQDVLISGTNIKTIDGNSVLGAGNLIVDKTYRHVQILASSTWVINHFLNKMPTVTAVNSFGQQVIGEITYESLDRVVVNYSGAFSGEAYLN